MVRYQLRYFPNGIKTAAKVRIKSNRTREKEEKTVFLAFFFAKNLHSYKKSSTFALAKQKITLFNKKNILRFASGAIAQL
ncbi:MAG: hypothetical protein IIV77_04270, partial [Bacteroidaceae bacterium]|nr:hypothetical protein [Bacteroidaceae bacterium]